MNTELSKIIHFIDPDYMKDQFLPILSANNFLRLLEQIPPSVDDEPFQKLPLEPDDKIILWNGFSKDPIICTGQKRDSFYLKTEIFESCEYIDPIKVYQGVLNGHSLHKHTQSLRSSLVEKINDEFLKTLFFAGNHSDKQIEGYKNLFSLCEKNKEYTLIIHCQQSYRLLKRYFNFEIEMFSEYLVSDNFKIKIIRPLLWRTDNSLKANKFSVILAESTETGKYSQVNMCGWFVPTFVNIFKIAMVVQFTLGMAISANKIIKIKMDNSDLSEVVA